MQQDQLKGMLDRVGLVLATWFLAWMVRKGWIGTEDSAVLLPGLILLPALAWGYWNNRNKALVQSAANVPGTVVVTSPELAAATPDQNNIVSNTNVEVKTR
jgi:hypothetical protein